MHRPLRHPPQNALAEDTAGTSASIMPSVVPATTAAIEA